jgi:mannose-6-phosphate isomerase
MDTMQCAFPYPLTFSPVYKGYIWGGRRLAEIFGRRLPPGVCAESWELTDRPEGMSVVSNGPDAGRTLRELVDALGPRLVGTAYKEGPFPLLVKIIDARERLSLQVHPSGATAGRLGGEPKTEMWVVLTGTTAAHVFAGLRPGADRQVFSDAIHEGAPGELVGTLPIKPGDAVYVPSGLIHAIEAGSLLLEIQQNSDTTYRLHDWGRLWSGGRRRPLQIEQGLQAIDWTAVGTVCPPVGSAHVLGGKMPPRGGNLMWELCSCPHFRVGRMKLSAPQPCGNDGRSFHALFVQAGRITVAGSGRTLDLPAGSTCLLPAALAEYTVSPAGEPPAQKADIIHLTL